MGSDQIFIAQLPNRDLIDAPELQRLKSQQNDRTGQQLTKGKHSTSQKKNERKSTLPSQQLIPASENFAVAQVKSLLDLQPDQHETTSAGKIEETNQQHFTVNSVGDLSQAASVQNVNPCDDQTEPEVSLKQQHSVGDTITAMSYVRDLIDRVDQQAMCEDQLPARSPKTELQQRSEVEYFDAAKQTEMQLKRVPLEDDDHGCMNMSLRSSVQQRSTRKEVSRQQHLNQSFQLRSNKRVVIGEQKSWASKSQSRHRSPHKMPDSLVKPGHTAQHRYHEHCGCGHQNKQYDNADRVSSTPHNRSIMSYRSGSQSQRPPKFISQPRPAKTGKFNQGEAQNLNRIKERISVLDNRMNQSMAQKHPKSPLSLSRVQPNVKQSSASRAVVSRLIRQSCHVCLKCKKHHDEINRKHSQCQKMYPKFVGQKKGSSIKGVTMNRNQNDQCFACTISQRDGSACNEATPKVHGIGLLSSQMSCKSLGPTSNYKKILNRKFKIDRDLSKYSKELSYSQTARKVNMFDTTRRGKNLADMRKRAHLKVHVEAKHDREREIMKTMDWSESDLYEAYKESKRMRRPLEKVLIQYAAMRMVNGDKMYSDVELQYYTQLIRKRDCKENSEEVQAENRQKIVLEYFNRSLYTLQGLTKLLRIEFHYERLFQKYETAYTVDSVLMLMTRARKLYQAIEMIITIIKLIEKLKALESVGQQPTLTLPIQSHDRSSIESIQARPKDPALAANLSERIKCHIKSFLAQHTLFPVQFKFAGTDQLDVVKPTTQPKKGRPGGIQLTEDSRIINLNVGGGSPTPQTGPSKKKKKQKGKKSSRAESATKKNSVRSSSLDKDSNTVLN